MASRTESITHGVEVIGAAAFGVMVTVPSLRWYSVLPAIVAIAALVFQIRGSTRPWQDDVRARLELALPLLAAEGQVRATFHVVERQRDGAPHRYRQAIDYVPGGTGRDRTFPVATGIVGTCIAEGGQHVVNFQDRAQFDRDMSGRFGFGTESQSRPTPNRRSYIAQAVTNSRGDVLGVVYMDSDRTGAFTTDRDCLQVDIVERIAHGLGGIVR
jgi:hypothetical protein